MIVSDFAIVLNTRKYSDSSKIITLFTKLNGKISLIAKGARNTKSKFGSSLEPLSYNKVSYYLYHNKDLHLLSGSEYQIHFKNITESVSHLACALAIMESINLCQEPYHKNEELFDFIIDYLVFLDKSLENPFSAYLKFQIELMKILGFGLKFESNIIVYSDDVFINIENGELSNSQNGFKMYKINFNKLKYISENEIGNSTKVNFDEKSIYTLSGFINRYFQYHLDKHYYINSLEMLQ